MLSVYMYAAMPLAQDMGYEALSALVMRLVTGREPPTALRRMIAVYQTTPELFSTLVVPLGTARYFYLVAKYSIPAMLDLPFNVFVRKGWAGKVQDYKTFFYNWDNYQGNPPVV